MSKRVSFKVEGVVQGVNFRSWTASQADKLNITGYVKNESDGTVRGEAQGDSSALDKFQQHLGQGPGPAKVSNVEINDIATKEGEKGFSQIRR